MPTHLDSRPTLSWSRPGSSRYISFARRAKKHTTKYCNSSAGIGPRRRYSLATKLRYVDPTHQPSVLARVYAALAATRLARFVSRHVSWKLDPLLLRATRGRLATTLVFPTAVLETTGAK